MNQKAMPDNFIPSTDAATLAERAAATMHATANLLQSMLLDMTADKHQAIDTLLARGGRIGIESTVNGLGETSLHMVGFTSDGERLQLSTVQAPTTGLARH